MHDLETLFPFIENVHLADAVPPKHVHLPLGQGTIPVAEVLTFLTEYRYGGNVIVEEMGGGFSSEAFIEHACHFRDSFLGAPA